MKLLIPLFIIGSILCYISMRYPESASIIVACLWGIISAGVLSFRIHLRDLEE